VTTCAASNGADSRILLGGRVKRIISSMMKNQKQIRARPNSNRRANRGNGSSFPPPLTATLQIDMVVRYEATGALSNTAITSQDLIDSIVVATAANAAADLPVSAKIRKVEMWAPPAATAASVTLSIEDSQGPQGGAGPVGGPSRIRSDVSMGTNRPAHVVWRPRPGSLQALWQTNGVNNTEPLLLLTGPVGTVLDLHASWTLQDGENVQGPGAAVAGATTGRLYLRALDSNGSALLGPVSFPTI